MVCEIERRHFSHKLIQWFGGWLCLAIRLRAQVECIYVELDENIERDYKFHA
jgi:hypothetical protein